MSNKVLFRMKIWAVNQNLFTNPKVKYPLLSLKSNKHLPLSKQIPLITTIIWPIHLFTISLAHKICNQVKRVKLNNLLHLPLKALIIQSEFNKWIVTVKFMEARAKIMLAELAISQAAHKVINRWTNNPPVVQLSI